ncbi:SLC15A4 [Branchiostoma lanceolatum]|uniref:SLC15A4 protein n=1 Tax=Branchiostoma lanceolatum TaxID=7740 RepID=A0A8J9Z4D2_BRALA|nr:SLC15A4 [Branchiostoma lanceolatum]
MALQQDQQGAGRFPRVYKTSLIIGLSELCERVAYYGIVSNMALFTTSHCFPRLYHEPSTFTYVFTGFAYVLTIVGGWLADAVLSRFWTILGSLGVYFVGTVFLILSSYFCAHDEPPTDSRVPVSLYLTGLCLVAVGTGGSKSNLGLYGAGQYGEYCENLNHQLKAYFHWYYWCINVGAAIADLGVAYLQEVHTLYGYVVICIAVFLSGVVFVIGKRWYEPDEEKEEVLGIVAGILRASKRAQRPVQRAPGGCMERWLDRANESRASEEVDDVKQLFSLLWIFLCLILYFTLYSQMRTTFLFQSQRLRLPKFGGTEGMDGVFLNVFNAATVLLMIPVMHWLVYPWMARMGRELTSLERMGIGMLLSVGSIVAAALVEVYRRQLVQEGHYVTQHISKHTMQAADMTVFVQIPQFLLSGMSEVMTMVTGYYFAYTQAPLRARGTVMGLLLLMWGLGSYASLGLSALFNAISYQMTGTQWFPVELNDGRAEWFFIFLAIFMLLDTVFFVFLAQRYGYKTYRQRRILADIGTAAERSVPT